MDSVQHTTRITQVYLYDISKHVSLFKSCLGDNRVMTILPPRYTFHIKYVQLEISAGFNISGALVLLLSLDVKL